MHRRTSLRLAVALASFVLGACDRDPVEWNDAAERRALVPPAGAAVTPDAVADSIRDATLAAAVQSMRGASPSTSLPPDVLNGGGTGCVTSVRVAAGKGGERAAVWWSARANGAAVLMSSRSADGGAQWSAPVRVDTLGVGGGCERPAPSIVVDTLNGYVHVAYSVVAPEGTGVFYAHRMGPTVPFEPPQVIVYGDRVTRTSVASDGDVVVVAYEDPNAGGRPYVSIALSRTAGHSWAERFAVSSENETAERPAVAVRGRAVAVGWLEPNAPLAMPADAPSTAASGGVVVVRVGRLR